MLAAVRRARARGVASVACAVSGWRVWARRRRAKRELAWVFDTQSQEANVENFSTNSGRSARRERGAQRGCWREAPRTHPRKRTLQAECARCWRTCGIVPCRGLDIRLLGGRRLAHRRDSAQEQYCGEVGGVLGCSGCVGSLRRRAWLAGQPGSFDATHPNSSPNEWWLMALRYLQTAPLRLVQRPKRKDETDWLAGWLTD